MTVGFAACGKPRRCNVGVCNIAVSPSSITHARMSAMCRETGRPARRETWGESERGRKRPVRHHQSDVPHVQSCCSSNMTNARLPYFFSTCRAVAPVTLQTAPPSWARRVLRSGLRQTKRKMSEKRQHLDAFGTPDGDVCKQYATESGSFNRSQFTARTRKSAQTPKKQGF